MLVGTYLFLDRLCMASLRAAEALHRGFWLGLLRPGALQAVTSRFYQHFPQYTDPRFNGRGLFVWERQAIERHFVPAKSVLVAACGGGRELAGLAALGFAVTGFDPDERLVRHAASVQLGRADGVREVLHSHPSHVPDGLPQFDAAVLGWGAYTHIVGRALRIRFLRDIASHLDDGAPLLLSFWDRPPQGRQLAFANAVARVVATISLNPRRPELGDWLGRHFTHAFIEPELRQELAEAGFVVVHYQSDPYAHAVARLRRGDRTGSDEVFSPTQSG